MESNTETCPTYKGETLERGESKNYCFSELVCNDSECSDDSDDEMDDVLKTFQDNYIKLRDYCKESTDHLHKYKELSDDLESFDSASDTYNSHALETKLVVGLPWSKEQLNSDTGKKDYDMQAQYNIWKLTKKYCNYFSKFKLQKAKECHRKLLELRTDFLDYSSNHSGLVRSTYVKTSESDNELDESIISDDELDESMILDDNSSSELKYRKNVCDVTLLPATEVYRLIAISMKRHYDNEVEMYEDTYDLRRQYSKYNAHMINKNPSIFQ